MSTQSHDPQGATGDAQNLANEIVDKLQELGNSVVDLGEEAARTVLDSAITANSTLGSVLEALKAKVVG